MGFIFRGWCYITHSPMRKLRECVTCQGSRTQWHQNQDRVQTWRFSMMAFSKEGRHRMRVTVRDIAQKFEDIEYLGIRKSRCTVKDRSFQVEGQGDLNSRKKWIRYLILVSYLRQASYLSFGENHYSNRLVVYEIQYMTSYMSLPLTKLFNPECRACSALNCKIGMIVSQCVCEESVS